MSKQTGLSDQKRRPADGEIGSLARDVRSTAPASQPLAREIPPMAREFQPIPRELRPLAGRLPAGAAFALQVSIVVFFLASSAAPTPLYALYQARWGFSPITTTVVFGIYAVAVLAALLVV